MAHIQNIIDYLNTLLRPELFQDYCPNGLQVFGSQEVRHIVSGVSACLSLIESAIAVGADTLLVHHGYFWRGEDPCIVGMQYKRLQVLLQHNINLIAYHLPLDAHSELGNNVQLGKYLDFIGEGSFLVKNGPPIACWGSLSKEMSGQELSLLLEEKLHRKPLHIDGAKPLINRIAWCSGAAQNFILDALALGVDAYVTGEISEHTVHVARENGIHFYAAGHHATERYGVQALGAHLAETFQLRHQFIDIPNPV